MINFSTRFMACAASIVNDFPAEHGIEVDAGCFHVILTLLWEVGTDSPTPAPPSPPPPTHILHPSRWGSAFGSRNRGSLSAATDAVLRVFPFREAERERRLLAWSRGLTTLND